MGILSNIASRISGGSVESSTSEQPEEKSIIKRRGMEKFHRPGDISEQGKEQYELSDYQGRYSSGFEARQFKGGRRSCSVSV